MVVSYKAQDVPQAGLCSSLLAASTARLDHSEGLRWAQERPSLSLSSSGIAVWSGHKQRNSRGHLPHRAARARLTVEQWRRKLAGWGRWERESSDQKDEAHPSLDLQ